MGFSRLPGRSVVALSTWLWGLAAFADDDLIGTARSLLSQQQPQRAYELLLPHEPQQSGTVTFDHLLGIAALDAGDPQRAVFALERVLALEPGNEPARAEMARALLALGERENARQEFETLRRSESVPGDARRTIDRYLSLIEPARTRLAGFVEAAYGFDTNINSATSQSQIALPAFGGTATLTDSSLRRRDSFWGWASGLTLQHALDDQWTALASLNANGKTNRRSSEFDNTVVDGLVGLRYTRGANAFTAAFEAQQFTLDQSRFRETHGGHLQWLHRYSDSTQVTAFIQSGLVRFPTEPTRDATRTVGGLALAHAFGGKLSPVGFASAYVGNERTRQEGTNHLGHEPRGMRLGGQLTLAPGLDGFAWAAYEHRKYNGDDPIFLVRRVDQQWDYRVGAAYTFHPGWQLSPSFAYTDNRSTAELNRYYRALFSLAVRYSF